jgi:hypothetical protein
VSLPKRRERKAKQRRGWAFWRKPKPKNDIPGQIPVDPALRAAIEEVLNHRASAATYDQKDSIPGISQQQAETNFPPAGTRPLRMREVPVSELEARFSATTGERYAFPAAVGAERVRPIDVGIKQPLIKGEPKEQRQVQPPLAEVKRLTEQVRPTQWANEDIYQRADGRWQAQKNQVAPVNSQTVSLCAKKERVSATQTSRRVKRWRIRGRGAAIVGRSSGHRALMSASTPERAKKREEAPPRQAESGLPLFHDRDAIWDILGSGLIAVSFALLLFGALVQELVWTLEEAPYRFFALGAWVLLVVVYVLFGWLVGFRQDSTDPGWQNLAVSGWGENC